MLIAIVIVVAVVGAAVLTAAVVGFVRIMRRSGWKIPAFSIFTGRWSDEPRQRQHKQPGRKDDQVR